MAEMLLKRGEIYYINNGSAEHKARCEQAGVRPAVVISNDIGNYYSPVVIVAFLTTQNKKYLPTHVETFGTGKKSTVLLEQPTTVSKDKILGKCIGKLSEKEMKEVDKALSVSLGLL